MTQRRFYTREELSEVFRINESGELERLFKRKGWNVVDCKANRNDGYCSVRLKDSKIMYHTIMWILVNGTITDVNAELDHIDGNRINNRIENLRLVTSRENQQNSESHRNGRLVGCCFFKQSNKWRAEIKINGKKICLGYYNTELEAHQIYSEALTMLDKSVEEVQAYFNVAQFSSGYKGVTFHRQSGKWRAQIKINGKQIGLGYYTTEPESHQIYLKALSLIDQYIDNAQFKILVKQP